MHPIAAAALVIIGILVVAIIWLMWSNLTDIDERRYARHSEPDELGSGLE